MHEPKYPKRPFLNILIMAFIFFRSFTLSEASGTEKIGGGYNKFMLNGSEGFFYKIFDVAFFENFLPQKLNEIAFNLWYLSFYY